MSTFQLTSVGLAQACISTGTGLHLFYNLQTVATFFDVYTVNLAMFYFDVCTHF